MTTEPLSPKRRHILSSINPDARSMSPAPEEKRHITAGDTPPEPRGHDDDDEDRKTKTEKNTTTAAADVEESNVKTASKFRFKSKHSRSHRSSRRDRDHDRHRDRNLGAEEEEEEKAESSSRHRRSHRHKRQRRRTRSRTPPNPYEPPPLDAEAAFRESLFDAMADDEGAAYWEGVYGQPIHVYSQAAPTGPDGELERMDDDEYAAYVRRKMWEKTHQGVLEERARREERRRFKAERREEEVKRLTREMDESLRRGEERKIRKGWERYSRAWDPWDGTLDGLAWPVGSGRREDVDAERVREFYVRGIDPARVGEKEFLARLKEERVRWHPDKIQQRLGGRLDEDVMKSVTAVFQIVDKLWSDTRSKTSTSAG